MICVLILPILASCNSKDTVAGNYVASESVTNYVQVKMKDGKQFVLQLNPEVAPISVKNFQDLVEKGFYDGLTFHRIDPGFVIQGGDPEGNGLGGPGYNIKGEFKNNGVENPMLHKKGVLSMARSQAYDSAGSQFFIMLEAAPHLDGDYAAFGSVVLGMDQVDKIAADFLSGKVKENPVMEKLTFVKPK